MSPQTLFSSDDKAELGHTSILQRSATLDKTPLPPNGGKVGIQLPPLEQTPTRHARIPIEFRTLSLQVYDSQRFDAQSPSSGKKDETDAEFFNKLDFHLITPSEIYNRFNVSPSSGLDSGAASRRLDRNGRNILIQRKSQLWKKLLRYTFGDFCSILWIGVIIFFISWKPLGNPPAPYNLALAIVVLLVIIMQAVFSGFQDWSAQQIMSSILTLVPENAIVWRDGQRTTIPSSELVVGDVVELTMGQKVPADMRIVKASNDLRFDKSILTGESEEIAGTVESDETNFLEAKNIALLGTHVCNGTATAVVVLTASRTVMGRINKATNTTTEERTTLQKEITRFVKIIIALTLTLVIIMLITWLAWLRVDHFDFINTVGILTNLMALVVAFIPEGMPMAVALTLSTVAKRMRDVQILPKSLAVVETLGFVNVICSDKTGTLTQNRMTVASLSPVDHELDVQDLVKDTSETRPKAFHDLHRAMVLCNDAFFDTHEENPDDRKVQGNATDGALLRLTASIPRVEFGYNRVFDLPFNSRNKFAMTYVRGSDCMMIIKGAPDILLDRAVSYLGSDGLIKPLDVEARDAILGLQEKWSRKGQRVLLLAQRVYTAKAELETIAFEEEMSIEAQRELTILGLVGIVDPPRPEIPHTVIEARRCGSRFFMVTGDFRLTAEAIAKEIGIFTYSTSDRIADFQAKGRYTEIKSIQEDRLAFLQAALVVEGKEIDALGESDWDVICKYEEIVFARTTPEQKLRIVIELRSRGCVVAVTGDGVNDAPALKAANVGVAMISGSEVAMEAADLVLMGSFSSIIDGIRLGRLVFQNLQKVISYLLPAGSWSEDWPVILNVFFGCPLPLSSFLMIIICCFTDLACCLTLIFEQEEFDLLTLPPRDPQRSHLVNFKIYAQSYLFIGIMETLCAHSMFFYYIWSAAGIPANKMFFTFAHYSEGYYGHTQAELNKFLSTGQCVYFVTLVILQFFNLNSVRNKRQSIFQNGPQRNWKLCLGPVVSLAIAIFVTEQKGIQNLFGTASVPIKFWMIPIPLGLGILIMDEVRKVIVRTWPKGIVAKVAW